MVMGGLVPAGMLFVRCAGGISHNPAEAISAQDGELALAALTRFALEFRA
jgi:allantoate deiminase